MRVRLLGTALTAASLLLAVPAPSHAATPTGVLVISPAAVVTPVVTGVRDGANYTIATVNALAGSVTFTRQVLPSVSFNVPAATLTTTTVVVPEPGLYLGTSNLTGLPTMAVLIVSNP